MKKVIKPGIVACGIDNNLNFHVLAVHRGKVWGYYWDENDDPDDHDAYAEYVMHDLADVSTCCERECNCGNWLEDRETKKKYIVVAKSSGARLGVYSGESPESALNSMARDAGYRDYKDACEVSGEDPDGYSVNHLKDIIEV